MNLYEINAEMAVLLEQGFDTDCIDIETGEILTDKATEKLNTLMLTEAEKIENTALYIKNLSAEVEALKAEEKSLASRRKTKENKAEWLKSYLAGYLDETKRDKFETAKCALSFRKSEAVEIIDEAVLREYAQKVGAYLKFKEPDIDKTAIKNAIKSGETIAGVELIERKNLQVK